MRPRRTRTTWILCAALALGGCGGGDSDPSFGERAPETVHAAERDAGGSYGSADDAVPGIDCLTDERGVRRKVLVHRSGASIHRTPAGQPTGKSAAVFRPYFLFACEPSEESPRWFQVGTTPRMDSMLGWVSARKAVEWSTRVGARQIVSESGRTVPLLVYENLEDLIELTATGTTDAEPIARARAAQEGPRHPWPIAEVHREQVGEQHMEFHRLQFLGRFDPASARSAEAPDGVAVAGSHTSKQGGRRQGLEVRSAVRQIDLVFVMDVTGSMGPYLEEVKSTVDRISARIAGLQLVPDLAFGICGYRDHDASSGFVTRHLDLTEDRREFLTFMDKLEASGGGDGTEAVYDGVSVALEETQWRGQGLSHRILVLVGDMPAHLAGTKGNPRGISSAELRDRAKELNVTVFALGVGGDQSVYQRKRRSQFERLSKGSGGAYFSIDQAPQLTEHVKGLVEQGAQLVATRAQVVDAKLDGSLASQMDAGDISVEDVTAVMEFLRDHGDVELDEIGPGRPAYGTGWVLAAVDGAPTTEKMVWLARSELDFLMSQLQEVVASLAPRAAESLFSIASNSRTGSFLEESRPATMRAWLQARGVPCHAASILNFTSTGLFHISEEERRQLRERISRSVMPELLMVRNSDRFRRLDGIDWGWIAEAALP